MTTGKQLLSAILADPEDDTVRLVYADWLEENGQADRAEFIRVQVQLGFDYPEDRCHCGVLTCERCAIQWKRCALQWKASSLKLNNPSWSQVQCPDCAAGLVCIDPKVGAWEECSTCDRTGDLLRVSSWHRGLHARAPSSSRNPVFLRGFLDSLECQWGELGEGLFLGNGQVFSPSPWARAVVEAVPTLTRLRVFDREPGIYGTRSGFNWTRLNTEVIPSDFNAIRGLLPPVLWDRLDGFLLDNPVVPHSPLIAYLNTGTFESPVWSETLLSDLRFTRRYPTRDAAHDALARAACSAVTEGLKEGSIRPHFAPD